MSYTEHSTLGDLDGEKMENVRSAQNQALADLAEKHL
jgi:hypothetical protein